MKFKVDGNSDTVRKHYGLNEDGVEFLFGDNYTGQTIDAATKTVCDKLKNYNIVNGTKILRVTAYSSDSKTHKVLENKRLHIASKIQNLLSGNIGSVIYIDDDLIDEIEDWGDDLPIDMAQIITKLKGQLRDLVNKKIGAINELLASFNQKYEDNEIVSIEDMNKINKFCSDYKFDLKFIPITGKLINEFCEDLKDLEEDLEKCLDEIDEIDEDSDDDYGEILADLIEMAKESIFNN